MIEFKTSKGAILQFEDKPLSQGGEGAVYKQFDELGHGDIGDLAKTFHNGKSDGKEEKIKAMLSIEAPLPSSSFAWPKEILYDVNTGEFRGYVMYMKYNKEELGKISAQDSKYRTEKYWNFYVTVARNLARTIAGLHKINQVVGDLNDKNVLVDMETAEVTLIDNDSFHITVNNTTHRCSVGMGEYIAPEIQGINFREADMPTFTKHTDTFSLAILIFKLLMNGLHPFNSSTIDETSIEENIKNGRSLYFQNENKGKSIEPPYAPPIDILPNKLYKLFKAAFNDSKNSPQKRPSAQDFYNELDSLSQESNLQLCSNKKHKYPKNISSCPWCFVDEKMRRLLSGEPASADFTFTSYSKAMKKTADKAPPKTNNQVINHTTNSDDNYGDVAPVSNQMQSMNANNNKQPNISLASSVSVPIQNSASYSAAMPKIVDTTTAPAAITKTTKSMSVLGCIGVSLLTTVVCAAGFIFNMPLITGGYALIMIILALLYMPKTNSDYAYNKIVEFPSYATVKCKNKKSVWYIVISKYKLLLFNFLSIAAIISLFLSSAIDISMELSLLRAFISFTIASVFVTFFVVERRTYWRKTVLGIIIGVIGIITIVLSFALFSVLLYKFISGGIL